MEVSIKANSIITTVKINNMDIINSYIQHENKEVFINQLLENGYNVSKCLQPIISRCGCCEQINELTESMQILTCFVIHHIQCHLFI